MLVKRRRALPGVAALASPRPSHSPPLPPRSRSPVTNGKPGVAVNSKRDGAIDILIKIKNGFDVY